jgi:hypothetical protein
MKVHGAAHLAASARQVVELALFGIIVPPRLLAPMSCVLCCAVQAAVVVSC